MMNTKILSHTKCLQLVKLIIVMASAMLMLAAPANAQKFSGAFAGMRDSKQPVQIEADRLEVLDGQGIATFDGNVNVVQGSTVLQTSKLKVYYLRDGGNSGPAGNVRRIVATGKVAVRSGEERATADSADVDMKNQLAVLTGNVTLTQGNNIVTGCGLKINLVTNAATLSPCKQGRVKMLFDPKSTN